MRRREAATSLRAARPGGQRRANACPDWHARAGRRSERKYNDNTSPEHSSVASRQPPAASHPARLGARARARVWRFRLFGLKGNSSCSFDPATSRIQFRLLPIRLPRRGSSGDGSAQPERRETKCKKEGAKPPHGVCWANKLSHGLAHITRPSPIALGDHRCALRTRDARSKIVHDIMI